MKVVLNGSDTEISAATVAELVARLGLDDTRGVAVAVDAEVVPRSLWNATGVREGQRVEVLRATQGG